MRLIIIISIVFLSGCLFSSNKKSDNTSTSIQREEVTKAIDKQVETVIPSIPPVIVSGNVEGDVTITLPPYEPIKPITFESNTIASADISKRETSMTSEKLEQSNPMTLIFWGIGLFILLITTIIGVWWIKRQFSKFSLDGGERGLNSMLKTINDWRKDNMNEEKDKLLKDIEADIHTKLISLNNKR